MITGGIGAKKEVDEHLLSILESVDEELKAKISEKLNAETPYTLEPIAYKSQLVAGTNYFVNLKLGDGLFIHARIYKDLRGNSNVHSVTDTKNEDVEIIYF